MSRFLLDAQHADRELAIKNILQSIEKKHGVLPYFCAVAIVLVDTRIELMATNQADCDDCREPIYLVRLQPPWRLAHMEQE